MKIKKAEFPVLNACFTALDSCVLPRALQNRITTFTLKTFDVEYAILNKVRTKLCESYAKKDEKGNIIYLKVAMQDGSGRIGQEYDFDTPELKSKCEEELLKLESEEVDFNFEPVTPDALGEAKIPGFVEKNLKRLGFIII
jgi:hypothetical protein